MISWKDWRKAVGITGWIAVLEDLLYPFWLPRFPLPLMGIIHRLKKSSYNLRPPVITTDERPYDHPV